MSTPTPQLSIAPSPSISSSRRTSLETATRSSTVGSPSLGPTTISASTSNSATQLAASRRNRAALRDFYGLKDPSGQNGQKDGGSTDEHAEGEEVKPSILDEPGFDANEYVKGLLGNEGLEGVLKTESNLVTEIRSLDGDRKALVYDNYSKLITATETIRRMRANMDPLTPTTSTLAPAISHIAGTAEKVAEDMKRRADVVSKGSKAADGLAVESKNQAATVKWIFGAAKRYQNLIEKGDTEAAEEDWQQVKRILQIWEKKGVNGAEQIRESCEEIMVS